MASKPRTLYEKIWDAHVVDRRDDGTCLIYIDRHLVHEVTSPQAFEALRVAGRTGAPARPDAGGPRSQPADHRAARRRGQAASRSPTPKAPASSTRCASNAPAFGVRYIDAADAEQGIVHVVGPEQGFSLPGATIVCGDSHTACHGGLGALAFGIGTTRGRACAGDPDAAARASRRRWKCASRAISAPGVTPKDLILHIIGVIGTAGGTGHVIEYRGKVFEEMSIEGRLTVCNMSIEGGARAGLVAPDETTFAYLKGRPYAPKGADWDKAVAWWRSLATDPGAKFDKSVTIQAADIEPTVTWGTSPEDVVAIGGVVPAPESFADPSKQQAAQVSLDYMGLAARHADDRHRSAERVHRIVHQQPHRGPARRRRGAARAAPRPLTSNGRSSSPARAWSSARPRPRASTRCSPTPASNGASRAARPAWA